MIAQNNPTPLAIHRLADKGGFLYQVFSSGQESTIASLLEEELLRRWGVSGRSFFLPSYKAAFALALRLANIAKEDAIFYPLNGSFDGAEVSSRSGASLCFVDVGSDRLSISSTLLKNALQALSRQKKARQRLVVVDHFAGIPAETQSLLSLIREEALVVIENATALQWREEHLRTSLLGGYRIFSAGEFFEGRGSSGVVLVVPTEERYQRGCDLLRRLRVTSSIDHYYHDLSYDMRVATTQLVRAWSEMESVDKLSLARRQIIQRYRERLSPVLGLDLFYPSCAEDSSSTPLGVLLSVDKSLLHFSKNELLDYLNRSGIEAVPLSLPLHLHTSFRGYPHVLSGLSEAWYERALFLPCGSGLPLHDVDYVADQIIDLVSHYN